MKVRDVGTMKEKEMDWPDECALVLTTMPSGIPNINTRYILTVEEGNRLLQLIVANELKFAGFSSFNGGGVSIRPEVIQCIEFHTKGKKK